ncbi:DUF4142 domain-containing protein [Streptomyces silvisoli]|uniref:DUF4142 domain-containing protein n=1 Tax=Streptomyces silvisoli TaxID=3034235 RepID=A0ABT5ZU32_9ACTN|nr:DUF4142 domain-containing protein [Streptomyces silvisoli]MDF3293246.1 DUF4142 domain-containing protein [Streptomyces silvisoli]
MWLVAACGAGPSSRAGARAAAPTTNKGVSGTDLSLRSTSFGPLSAADQKLLALVRETSLREITTSQMALKKSSNEGVKQAAQMISKQHVELEQRDLDVAGKLGLRLPDKPSPDMQVGIDRMRGENGTAFDDDYVNTLRQAHGEALILISKVRADSQNSLVRSFADLADGFIKMHIQALEKTGDVDYSKLPVPTPDAA